MGRMRRELYLSAIYHVYNRGNNRMNVFPDRTDKEKFLELIVRYRERFGFMVYAICLMDNHYHMLIKASHKHPISRIMQVLMLSYSNHYRRKYKYEGHVWQSRYKSRVIEREKYLFECIDYIHENPVKSEIVKAAGDYPYSSARVFEGRSPEVGECLTIDSLKEALYS